MITPLPDRLSVSRRGTKRRLKTTSGRACVEHRAALIHGGAMKYKPLLETMRRERPLQLLFRHGTVAVCGLLAAVALFGQTNVGGIVGTVSDSSGGTISGATVTLINPATNERQETRTNAE